MTFLIFTFLVGLISSFSVVFLLRFLVRKFHINPKIFWKAGLAGIAVSLLVFGVNINIDGAFPSFSQLPNIVQAAILGVLNGLIIELGKFTVLDRLMRKVRDRESGLMFGLGWAGVGIVFTGFLLAVSVFGTYSLLNTKDIASSVPNIDPDQLKFLQESQVQIQALVSGSLLKAFTPLFESAATILLDIAATFMILFGFQHVQNRFVWFAVGIRSVLTALLFYAISAGFPPETVFVFWMGVGILIILQIKKRLRNQPSASS